MRRRLHYRVKAESWYFAATGSAWRWDGSPEALSSGSFGGWTEEGCSCCNATSSRAAPSHLISSQISANYGGRVYIPPHQLNQDFIVFHDILNSTSYILHYRFARISTCLCFLFYFQGIVAIGLEQPAPSVWAGQWVFVPFFKAWRAGCGEEGTRKKLEKRGSGRWPERLQPDTGINIPGRKPKIHQGHQTRCLGKAVRVRVGFRRFWKPWKEQLQN
ncbi:hypothetical protein B0J18DRAFT_85011 [Chaetomium sp. MPI-SDFR-AT-0129]|nr:hypothetical protein B0J18DRAFT_85011 [Chaetomium sp. MPI-SDFR-AT-0129]